MGGQEGSRKVQRRGNGQWEAGRKAALSAVSSQRERERSVTAGRRRPESRPTTRPHASAGTELAGDRSCHLPAQTQSVFKRRSNERHARGIYSLNRYSPSPVSREAVAILK